MPRFTFIFGFVCERAKFICSPIERVVKYLWRHWTKIRTRRSKSNFLDRVSTCNVCFICADNFQGLPPEAIPAFLQNLQNSAGYNIAKPIARPAAYHPYHRPSHQPPQRHLPPNAHHTLQQLFYRGPYLTGKEKKRRSRLRNRERKKICRRSLPVRDIIATRGAIFRGIRVLYSRRKKFSSMNRIELCS